MSSSKVLIVLALPFRYLTHFELNFVYSIRKGLNFILLHVMSSFPELFIKKVILSSLNYLNQLIVNVRVYLWTHNSFLWVSVCPCIVSDCLTVVLYYILKLRCVNQHPFPYLFQTVFGYSWSLECLYEI